MFSKLRGRKGRLAGIVAAIPLALGLTVGVAQPAVATSASAQYVALGDSFTAGQGAGGPYDVCNRSQFGYPNLVDDSFPTPVLNVACAAATTEVVRTVQLPRRPDWNVRLVTMTVGGNDLGFSELGKACLNPELGSSRTCEEILTVTPQEARRLFTDLVKTYWTVKAIYPRAEVVVLSYPRIFAPDYQHPILTPPFVAAVNAAGDVVHQVIVAATRLSPVTFVDVRDEFQGHELGGPLEDWINPIEFGVVEGLHPNALGYRDGYFLALVNAGVVPGP